MANFEEELRHKGLNKYQVIKASTSYELRQKREAKLAQWDEQWKKKQELERKKKDREKLNKERDNNLKLSEDQTKEAENRIFEVQNLLKNHKFKSFDWKEHSRSEKFSVKKPVKEKYPIKGIVKMKKVNSEPNISNQKYISKKSFLDKIIKSRSTKIDDNDRDRYDKDYKKWEEEKKKAEEKFIKDTALAEKRYSQKIEDIDARYNEKINIWEEKKKAYNDNVKKRKIKVDLHHDQYISSQSKGVEYFAKTILDTIDIPIKSKKKSEVEYIEQTKMLIVNYYLPNISELPTAKAINYIKSRNEFVKKEFNQKEIQQFYDEYIYQLILLILHSLFISDSNKCIQSISLNCIVESLDSSTGRKIMPCIATVLVDSTNTSELNFERIDAKSWFRSVKGIAATALHNITPVAPISTISTSDKRFVDSYSVFSELNEANNLAAMDWQDFENLIREVFEQEFKSGGGEVKITQSSRDGGVDAIAFDPDPIKGGKIFIQAKRYTNIVGVANVRDLHGTILHEGATKGILVTTSNYGADSYEFAKNKPITLINGSELLFLLDKHGHKARIDLQEAKEILKKS